jgi:nitrite reductase/ring-hydroxylating ferredoxin subunit
MFSTPEVATMLLKLPVNQALSACSTMTLKGINVVCSCDNNEYSLFTGLSQGGSQYPLKQYRVEVNGTILRVYN